MLKHIGFLVSGSYEVGLSCLLNQDVDLQIGAYCKVVLSEKNVLLCLVTDIQILSLSNFDFILQCQNSSLNKTFSRYLTKYSTQKIAKMNPLIVLAEDSCMPVTFLPNAMSMVFLANENDFGFIFGKENLSDGFYNLALGSPVGVSASLCVDLQKIIERSNGIFGKTGTGKTFLTRILLAGLISSDLCVNLIFDMHGEYSFSARSEGKEEFVLGLKSLFPSKVIVFSLDPEASRRRGCFPDVDVQIDLVEISVEDIISLQEELCLHSTAIEVASLLFVHYGKKWLYYLLSDAEPLRDLAVRIGAHLESLSALYRKLKRLGSLPFITRNGEQKFSVSSRMLEFFEKKTSVVLEFGRQSSSLVYLLVSGILTRQIHKYYVKKVENFLATQQPSDKPTPLVITIEEAHNFLSSYLAKQTIFGKIAREMRKYFVTLLVVDQRPSGICEEIISQLGTKILTKLEDEKDINAAFSGTSNSVQLKTLNKGLRSSGQAIIFGHAISIPMLFNTRRYDDSFYKQIQPKNLSKSNLSKIEDIFS